MRLCLAFALFASSLALAPASLAQAPPPQPVASSAHDDNPTEPGPRVIPWDPGEPVPPGYHPRKRPRYGLVIGGSLLLGTAWLPTTIVTIAAGQPVGAVPVFGPFVVATSQNLSNGDGLFDRPSSQFGVMRFGLVFSGLQQAAGLAMVIAGMSFGRPVLVREDTKAAKAWWMPVPMSFGGSSGGLGIVGTM